jgi:hypothetical protein
MKRCYILGAGFSKACGLPLAKELSTQISEYQNGVMESVLDAPSSYPTEPQRDFLGQLFPDYDLRQNWPDFEQLITVLDEWQEYRLACGNTADESVRHLRESLLSGLHNLLCERVVDAHKADRLNAVRDFVKRVHDEQSTIVSFNWDLLLEVAAQDIDLGVAYQKPSIKDTIRMAKPHGSLNLAELPEQEYEEKKTAINVGPRDMQIEWRHEKSETVVLRIRNPVIDPKGMVYTLGPIVVPPAARKTYQSPWISYQWHLAFDMVRNADELVIIGYSLPHTDIRPRLLLQLARFRRNRIPIRLIDPRAEQLIAHFESVVGKPLDAISERWEHAVQAI